MIAAPAVLTNASSVLALGTSNRFARAVDRARLLSAQMEAQQPDSGEWHQLRLRQLTRVEKRCVLLVNALTLFYLALGSFAAASLVSLLGAMFATTAHRLLFRVAAIVALAAGTVGVGGLALGCSLLVTETRLAVQNLKEEGGLLRKRYDDYIRNSERKA